MIETLLKGLDEEIARLTKVRELLAGGESVPVHRGPGRPPKSASASIAVKAPPAVAAPARKRVMSEEARKAIGEAQRKRWAKSKRAAAKAARAAAPTAPSAPAKKAPAKKTTVKKATRKVLAKKSPSKKSAAKSAPAKKASAKKSAPAKVPAKRGRPAKAPATKSAATSEQPVVPPTTPPAE